MTILGIGVDLVHLPRIADLLLRRDPNRFVRRILTQTEISQWKVLANDAAKQIQFLAVRYVISVTYRLTETTITLFSICSWCVKEAAYKALYPVVKASWKELTYRGISEGNKPTLEYHPIERKNAGKVGRVHVSVSHDGEYVYSSVLIEGLVGDIRTNVAVKLIDFALQNYSKVIVLVIHPLIIRIEFVVVVIPLHLFFPFLESFLLIFWIVCQLEPTGFSHSPSKPSVREAF